MPQPPNVDGLPLWLQITLSLIFVTVTGFAAVVGYRNRLEREPLGAAQTVIASIPDMSAVRQLTDMCRILSTEIEKLEAATREQTHYTRDLIEVGREQCMRLRELKEEMIRRDFRSG